MFFAHAPSALNADYPLDAFSRRQPNTAHVKDLPGLAGANSLKLSNYKIQIAYYQKNIVFEYYIF